MPAAGVVGFDNLFKYSFYRLCGQNIFKVKSMFIGKLGMVILIYFEHEVSLYVSGDNPNIMPTLRHRHHYRHSES